MQEGRQLRPASGKALQRVEDFLGPNDTTTEPPSRPGDMPRPVPSVEQSGADAEMDRARQEILYGEAWNGLARLRRHVERALQEIAPEITRDGQGRPASAGRLISSLRTSGRLSPQAAEHLQYAIRVANAAIHGREVSPDLADAAWRSASIGLAMIGNRGPTA